MKQTILITGGAGYIGSHAIYAFLESGYRVVVVDNLSTGRRDMVTQDAVFYQGDIADDTLIPSIIEKHAIAGIVHFAGSIIVPESVEKPLDYYHNNTVKSHKLVSMAVECGIKAFLFSSTAAVYGNALSNPIKETDALLPINPYGTSKRMTEQMLMDAATAYGLNAGALRYFNVAGADPKGRTGQCSPNSTHLIKIACETTIGKRQSISIFGTDYDTQDGTCIRDYIHVTDLVQAHVLAMDYLLAKEKGTSFIANCGYGRGYSVREILEITQQVSGKPVAIVEASRRAGDPAALVADNHYITSLLSWKPQHDDIEQIIANALAWETSFSGLQKKRA